MELISSGDLILGSRMLGNKGIGDKLDKIDDKTTEIDDKSQKIDDKTNRFETIPDNF